MLAMDDRKDADAAADDMKRREASGGPGPNVPLAARADVMEQVQLAARVSLPSALPLTCEAGEMSLAQAWLLGRTVSNVRGTLRMFDMQGLSAGVACWCLRARCVSFPYVISCVYSTCACCMGYIITLRSGALQGVQINRDWDYARNVEITNGR